MNKHKAKIYDQCMYTLIITKKFSSLKYKKKNLSGKYKNDKSIIWQVKINSTG